MNYSVNTFKIYCYRIIRLIRKIGLYQIINIIFYELVLFNKGKIFSISENDINKETVLIVSHEASRTGAPVLALNLLRQLSSNYNIVVVLLGSGELLKNFINLKKVKLEILNKKIIPTILIRRRIKNLCKHFKFKFAIVNTVESRSVIESLINHDIPTLTLIHEFASYIRPNDAFRKALFWSTRVIFSADIVRQNAFSEYPDLADCRTEILPQGKCLHPSDDRSEGEIARERARIKTLMRPAGLDPETFIVLGAGFVQMRKGVDLFIESASRVRSSLGGEKCRFIWIGKGYDPENDLTYSAYLKDQINRAGLQDHFLMIDETFAIETAYEEADLFLLSSRLDPLPNVAIEVMAYKVPVLCFDKTTGIANFLVENGLKETCVAQYMDTAEMGEKVLSLVNSKSLYAEVAQRCYEASLRVFDMDHYIGELERLALEAESQMQQERLDCQTILNSGLLQVEFYKSPQQADQPIESHIRTYVRGWASRIGRRKPFPGFHPGIYLEQHGVSVPGADPFADYIRSGCPQGAWNYLVIKDQAPVNKVNVSDNERVALHIHAYYPDLLPEIIEALSFNQMRPDLFISVRDHLALEAVSNILKDYLGKVMDIQIVPNRGRDIGPFLTQYGRLIVEKYEFVGHLHTKKSLELKDKETIQIWRKFLLNNLLGNAQSPMVDHIFTHFKSDEKLGIVFPDDPNIIGWSQNRNAALPIAQRLNIEHLPNEFLFPIGTMFWARTDALKQLIELDLNWSDYPVEPLPYDGSILHALERLMGFPSNKFAIATARSDGSTR